MDRGGAVGDRRGLGALGHGPRPQPLVPDRQRLRRPRPRRPDRDDDGRAGHRLPGPARGGTRTARLRARPAVRTAGGVGLVVAAVVPTDPLVAHVGGPALVHRYASIAAFVALPAAGLLLARRFEADDHARGTARWLRALACAALAGAVLMAYSAGPGGRELIGLVERLLLGCEVVLLGLLGRHVHRCPT
ncbi:DUF998 domain-containing protein [Streptomyces sp. NPDC091201]|uniref:DUF998 domain-containing protein n=1 Tax=Streptomyces sp. NPDC091201 TaxID=3155190 RepID=UPI0034492863